jgi:tetratricopeptide (TPR) repeat protein
MEQPQMMVRFLAQRNQGQGTAAADQEYGQVFTGGAPAPAAAGAPGSAPGFWPTVAPWSSLADPIPEQVARITDVAKDAARLAAVAAEDAKIVRVLSKKATLSAGTALAAVEDARQAARQAHQAELKVRKLRDQVRREARREAFNMLPSLLKKIIKKTHDREKKRTMVTVSSMSTGGKAEVAEAAQNAMQPYQKALQNAANTANIYQERAEEAVKAASSYQMDAEVLMRQANQFQQLGNLPKVQSSLKQAHRLMNMAQGLQKRADDFFRTQQQIEDTLPRYTRDAQAAAYHAELLLDPNVPPPPPPLVLIQQEIRHTVN